MTEEQILGKAINSCPNELDMPTYCQGFSDGYHECQKEHEWHLTKNELPELQTGNEYSDLVLCFRYYINNHGKKIKVYDLDRWNPENDIWESGKQRDEVEAWMYLPEPPEEI